MTKKTMVRLDKTDSGVLPPVEAAGVAERTPLPARPGIKPAVFAITPAKFLAALLFRWKLASCVALIFAIIGTGIAYATYKPKYTATATMRMTANKPNLLPGGHHIEETREPDFQKLQAQLVKSRKVLDEVLDKDDIRGLTTIRNHPVPQYWLEKELQAGFVLGTDIFRLGLSGENPKDVMLIVNAIQDVFVEQSVRATKKQHADRFDTIETVMVKAEEKIRSQREVLRRLAETHKTGDTQVLTLRQRMALEEFGAMKRELSTLESDKRKTDALLLVLRADLKNSDSEKVPPELIEEYMLVHPTILKEQTELAKLELHLKEARDFHLPESQRLQQIEEKLKDARIHLQKVKSDLQPEAIKKLRGTLLRQKAIHLEQAEEKLKVMQEQHGVVAAQVALLGREADKIGIGSFEIELRRSEIEEAEHTLKKLRSEKERLEIEKFNTKETIEARQEAEVPLVNQASLAKTGGLYALAGLLLGIVGVGFLEARLHRVHHSADIRQEMGIQTLGVLPLLDKKQAGTYGRPLPTGTSVSGMMFAGAVNSLCARLLCDDRLTNHAVILVSSANEGEGKTLLATQLAAGLGRSGRRTLLLDCDFRKPSCHEQFALAVGPGLSEVLAGEVELASALQTIPESDAQMLTAGKSNPDVIKSLSNGQFAALLARLRNDFDCIIIDSAPTLVISDGLLLGKLADGVLMVVRSKVSMGPAVFAAYEQLTALNIPTLGAVVNGNPAWAWSRYYAM